MASTITYKLVYFNIRTLGEPIRMMFEYMQVPYQDCRIDPAEWPQIKNCYKWRKLPELHVTKGSGESFVLTQTAAICRYLANTYPEFELMLSDPLDKARCDQIVDVVQDIRSQMKPYCIAKYFDPEGLSKVSLLRKEVYDNGFELYLGNLNEILEKKKGDFICGEKVQWADFFLANFTSIWEHIFDNVNLLEGYPFLKKQQKAVEILPNIQEWIAKRPKSDL